MPLKNDDIHRDLDTREFLRAFGYGLILTIFFAMVLFYICQSIHKVRVENEVRELIRSRAMLKQTNHRLRLERGFLKSLPIVEGKAKNKLGFVEPESHQLRTLKVISGENKDSISHE